MQRIATTRADVKPGHVNQLGDQRRVGYLDRAHTGRAGKVAQASRQRLAILGARAMRPLDSSP